MIISTEELKSWDKHRRTNLLNKLSGYKSAHLLGTKSMEGITNLATINTVIHVGANPFLLGYLSRPLVVKRHSFNNIVATGSYTLNQIHESIVEQAHQCSAKYPGGESEFEKVGLHEHYLPGAHAPCVQESKIKMLLQLKEIVPIKTNDTVFVIGEVIQFELDESSIESNGHLAMDKLETVAINGLDSYYRCSHFATLPYAKPE
ncbi:MAG: flavin oxidoreductase [Saprospiraceae bacterium]|nr:flavin oxidoreductase [Saprospiraceae bacterium]